MIIDPAKDLGGERCTNRPANCVRCSVALVAQAVTNPPEGHARYGACGMCKRCYNRHRRTVVDYVPVVGPTGQQKVRWDTVALLGFLKARRRRLGADGSLAEFPALAEALAA